MKIKFRTNLGSRDAGALGLDHEKCLVGETVDVSEDAGKVAIANGWAKSAGKSKPVIAVPSKPAVAESPPSSIGGKKETKSEK